MRLLFSLVLFPLWLFGQQPSHYIVGEQELEGIDIYSALHGTSQNYYLATSNGLIVYDGYNFTRCNCPNSNLSSVFNLVEDYAGNIFFNDLSGQVFQFDSHSCQLFYTIPDSYRSADIDLEVDNLNRLLVRANGLMFLNEKGTLVEYHNLGYSGFPTRMPDSSLSVYSGTDLRFYLFKNGKQTRGKAVDVNAADNHVFDAVNFGSKEYIHQVGTGNLYVERNGTWQKDTDQQRTLPDQQSSRVYSTTNSLWIAPNSVGVYRLDYELNTGDGEPIFSHTLVSAVCEDSEGNVILGTFGNGLMVIPNETTSDFSMPNKDEKVITIAKSDDGKLYFGTLSGIIYEYENRQIVQLRASKDKRMESLFSIPNEGLILGEFAGVLFNRDDEHVLGIGSVKDVARVDESKVLVGSNEGAYMVNVKTGASEQIRELAIRNFCVGFEFSSNTIYAGTANGLEVVSSTGKTSSIHLKGKNIKARDFEPLHDKTLVATMENGVLVFKNGEITDQWNTSTGLISNQVTQIQVFGNRVFIATDRGMQVLDFDGQSQTRINSTDGLLSERIVDFEVLGDELWVVHGKGVQRVLLSNLKPFGFTPSIAFHQIVMNDTSTVGLNQTEFNHDQQKFAFDIRVASLKYQNEIVYHYKLEGAESDWQQSAYSDHIIQYRSLAPGTYTFRAKAVCRGVESNEITYRFTIATPFYQAWWFLGAIFLATFGLLILLFRRRLKRQQMQASKENELNASKLTAIQSQMNPHFIFNALNSIQDLVLQGDKANSYSYISNFSDLVRRTLNYSDKDFIDFESELKLIELYLTLEKLRFEETFEYVIEHDGVADIQIPPMLVQPFIENALAHGLFHKEGVKKLRLKFELNEHLTCTITDNGVGRKRAMEIKERQAQKHQSFSVNAIGKRFEILQRYYDEKLGFVYEDLEENGEVLGTRVILTIPVKRKF